MIVNSKKHIRTIQSFRFIGLSVGAIVMILPFAYMVSTSFKKQTYLFEIPPQFIPTDPTFDNYLSAWGRSNFARYFFNSLFVASMTTLIVVCVASMSAYAFAKFNFTGKRTLFVFLILGLMVPTIVMIIPQFIMAKNLHLIDSFSGLILFYVGGSFALNTFLLRGFMEEIPKEFDEAMLVDGANAWHRFIFLYLPLSKPAIATVSVFSFLGAWDEFVWAVTLINSEEKRTLPIGIALFHGQHATSWGLVFAASIIALIPVLIVYLSAQKSFISGISLGGLKG